MSFGVGTEELIHKISLKEVTTADLNEVTQKFTHTHTNIRVAEVFNFKSFEQ